MRSVDVMTLWRQASKHQDPCAADVAPQRRRKLQPGGLCNRRKLCAARCRGSFGELPYHDDRRWQMQIFLFRGGIGARSREMFDGSYFNRLSPSFRSSMSILGSTTILVPKSVGKTATFRLSLAMPSSQSAMNERRSILSCLQSAHMSVANAVACSGWGQKGRHLHFLVSSVANMTIPSGPFRVQAASKYLTFDTKYRYL